MAITGLSVLNVLKLSILCLTLNQANSLNILGVFPYEGKSHFFVFQPLLLELSKRGHNITVISHFPQDKAIDNYHDISLAGKSKILEGVIPIERSYWSLIQISLFLVGYGTENCKLLLGDENVQDLWQSKAQFDLVLVEQFQSDCALGLAHQLSAPAVGLTSHFQMPWHYDRFGIQYNPSHMPHMFLDGGRTPSFYQRIERFIIDTYFNLLYKYYAQRKDENTLAQYFKAVPSLENLAENMRLMLLYQHYTMTGSTNFPSNVKEVGGYHVAKPKELPKDIKKFIEESEHGVIYISFGSMLLASTTPRHILVSIIEAISQLPQRVIWKWDDANLPGNPKNVLVSKWLPQNDILAHPKVVAFYSHCGLLGTTEAIHHGVPMIAMPVFGDQPGNAGAIVESGLGVYINVVELTSESLLEKFKTVLDPAFRANVKQLSKAWHDRPMAPMDAAVYWIEYAARQRNLSLKPASLDVPYYQYIGLDILLVLITVLLLAIVGIKIIWSLIWKRSKKQKLQ